MPRGATARTRAVLAAMVDLLHRDDVYEKESTRAGEAARRLPGCDIAQVSEQRDPVPASVSPGGETNESIGRGRQMALPAA